MASLLLAGCAWLKSAQDHDHGQLWDERLGTILFVGLSLAFLIATFARFPRYRVDGRLKLWGVVVLCMIVMICIALAIWNLSTAMVGAKDRLF
jgi:hypothetical protein